MKKETKEIIIVALILFFIGGLGVFMTTYSYFLAHKKNSPPQQEKVFIYSQKHCLPQE